MVAQFRRGLVLLALLSLVLPGALAQAPASPPSAPCAGNGATDNAGVTSSGSSQCTPDLYLSNLRHTPKIPDVRDSVVEMCADIINLGQTPSSPGIEVDFSVSNGDFVQQSLPNALASGQSQEMCINETSLGVGWYFFGAAVDPKHNFPESNYDNNERWCTPDSANYPRGYCFPVLPAPTINLRLVDFYVTPQYAQPDSVQTFVAIVRNVGRENLTTPTWLDMSDENGPISHLEVKPLATGESVRLVTTTNPNVRAVGSFTATAVVDPDQDIHEDTYADNVLNFSYGIAPHKLPDLLFLDPPTIKGNLTARHAIHVNGTVYNLGERGALSSVLRIQDGDKILRNESIPQLNVGQNSTFNDYLVLDPGVHHLRFIIDAKRTVAENHEDNNEYDQDVTIEGSAIPDVPLPDLLATRVTAQPDDPGPHDPVYISLSVQNIGTANSTPTTFRIDVDGVTLDVRKVVALRPNALQPYLIPWPNATTGSHAITINVDPDNLVNESDETDNAYSTILVLSPPGGSDQNATGTPTPTPTPKPTPSPIVPPTPITPRPPPVTQNATQNATADPFGIARIDVSTRPVPGGVKGILIATVRNNGIDRLGRISLDFQVDGASVKEVIVSGVGGAGAVPATTGEIDLPAGNHTITVNAHLAGDVLHTISTTQTYDAAPGPRSVPGPGLFAMVAAVGVALLVLRRK